MDELLLFVFTGIASTEGFLIATGVILAAYLAQRNARNAVALFLSASGMILATNFLKEALRVARPDGALIEVTGYAFPSGHAAGSAFLALVVAYLARRFQNPMRYVVLATAVFAALAIGASRIAYQVHTPLQVAAGFVVGAAFAFLFIRFASREN